MLKTFRVNDTCEITFDPLSREFAKKVARTFKYFRKYIDCEKVSKFSALEFDAANKEIRGKIDELFGCPVCDNIFGDTNVLYVSGDRPLWFNFMNALIEEIDRYLTEEEQSMQRKIKDAREERRKNKKRKKRK